MSENKPLERYDFLGLFSDFENCDCCQVRALKEDEAIAQMHIAILKADILDAIAQVLARPANYPYRTAFKFNTALAKLEKASSKLSTAKVKCHEGWTYAIAKAWPWGHTVHVYEPYWYFNDWGQGAHLVHEGTHMGSATTDATYFWQKGRAPRDTFPVPWNDIASTYDSWIINEFCIPGYDCPEGNAYDPHVPHIKRAGKECP